MIDKLVSQTQVAERYFLKTNGISPSFQRKQPAVFIAINKIQPLKSKLEVLKNMYPPQA